MLRILLSEMLVFRLNATDAHHPKTPTESKRFARHVHGPHTGELSEVAGFCELLDFRFMHFDVARVGGCFC
jgi:hypothetical protein